MPISVRSDRLGVLAVTFSGEPSDDLVRSLSGVARALGHAITVANRHTDVFERAARTQRLSLAAELQWQILPGRGCCGPDFDLAGQLEPAYHVAGDAFDWNVAPGHLTVCVLEGMGRGTRAAQATNLAVTALRNARRADLGLADQARMAAEAVYGQYGGELWIEASLLRFDRAERGLTIVNAGSPKIFRQQDDAINELVLDEELPLGRFDGADYRAQSIQLAAGDRIIVVSDGVHQAGPSDDRQFGEVRLGAVLRATRHLSPAETVRQVIRELRAHHLDGEIDDDAVAVVVDLKHPGD